MKFLRHAIAAILILLSLSFLFFLERPSHQRGPSIEGWEHYPLAGGRFTVDFPDAPLYDLKKLVIPEASKTLEYHEYVSQPQESVAYAVAYVPLPKSWLLARSKTILHVALKELKEMQPGTELVASQWTSHYKHPAIDFHFKQGDREEQGRLILAGGKVFKVAVVAPASLVSQEQRHLFVESFGDL